MCICVLHQSQHTCSSLIPTSKVTLVFHFRFGSSDRVAGREQGVRVMGNDRTGRGKYQNEACSSWGLRSCCSEAPRLLGSCHLIKAKSLPILAGIPHQTARGAFYPKQNATSCHSRGSATSRTRMAKFNTAEWKSIPCRVGVAQTGEGGNDEKVTRKMESWKKQLAWDKQEARWCQPAS